MLKECEQFVHTESTNMDREIAEVIFVVIMGAGIAVWSLSLWKALKLGKSASDFESQRFQVEKDLPFDDRQTTDECGTVMLTGDSEALSKAMARALQQCFFGQLSSIYQIRRHPDCRVVLKKTGPLLCNLPPMFYFSDATITFENRSPNNSVEVRYRLGFGRLIPALRRIALAIILGIGLPVMVLVGTLIWLLVIPSAIPSVQWQVLQTLQISHALWPPYMFMGLYGLGKSRSKTWLENLITNLDAESL